MPDPTDRLLADSLKALERAREAIADIGPRAGDLPRRVAWPS